MEHIYLQETRDMRSHSTMTLTKEIFFKILFDCVCVCVCPRRAVENENNYIFYD